MNTFCYSVLSFILLLVVLRNYYRVNYLICLNENNLYLCLVPPWVFMILFAAFVALQ